MLAKKIFTVSFMVLLICLSGLNLVIAQSPSPSPTPVYTAIPTISPSPEPTQTANQNSTVTGENSTYNQELANQIQSINPNGAPIQQPTYNRTVVSLIFASSVSCGVNASGGHWTATQDSAGIISFYPDEIGFYEVHFQVLYNRLVNQTIMLYIYSGDDPQPRVTPLQVCNTGFTLDVSLNIRVLPHSATPEELWDYGYGQFQSGIDAATEKINEQQAANTQLTYLLGAAIAIIAVFVAVIIIVLRRLLVKSIRWESRTW